MSSWADIRAAWSSRWQGLQREALRRYESSIRSNPKTFSGRVQAFVDQLQATRVRLNGVKARLGHADLVFQRRYVDLEKRYHELAAGFYADSQPVPGTGVAPAVVGLIVAGVLVGIAGIAWAVAAYEYAVNLREQTELADRELAARIDASQTGRALQPSTLPVQPDPIDETKRMGMWLFGGLAVIAGALTIPVLLQKR